MLHMTNKDKSTATWSDVKANLGDFDAPACSVWCKGVEYAFNDLWQRDGLEFDNLMVG
jgi:hypothetical protein